MAGVLAAVEVYFEDGFGILMRGPFSATSVARLGLGDATWLGQVRFDIDVGRRIDGGHLRPGPVAPPETERDLLHTCRLEVAGIPHPGHSAVHHVSLHGELSGYSTLLTAMKNSIVSWPKNSHSKAMATSFSL